MAGTPVGQQRASRVNIALPVSDSALACFRASITQGLRLGLSRSATRQFGCAPVRPALGTRLAAARNSMNLAGHTARSRRRRGPAGAARESILNRRSVSLD